MKSEESCIIYKDSLSAHFKLGLLASRASFKGRDNSVGGGGGGGGAGGLCRITMPHHPCRKKKTPKGIRHGRNMKSCRDGRLVHSCSAS